MASTATSRWFEFVERNSSKFWEVAVHGRPVQARRKGVGTSGTVTANPMQALAASGYRAG